MITNKQIIKAIPNLLKEINIPELGEKHHGKVRDFYTKGNQLVLITTDRQSAFDVNLGFVPFKGAVLNQLTEFWFKKTSDIVKNHMISVPDPNVMVGKKCTPIPIEMVIRGYITGSTNTSIWYSYKNGERKIYGIEFPNGLKKNQKLSTPVITPTTKGSMSGHDERMTREQILKEKVIEPRIYKKMEDATYALYKRGNEIAEKAGLIMPDTKYEFGMFEGELILMDELHTPDGSRFWIKKTYKERFKKGLEPENFDKEFIRLWYTDRMDPYKTKPSMMPEELMVAASHRYIDVYEKLTGKEFKVFEYPIEERIVKNLKKAGII